MRANPQNAETETKRSYRRRKKNLKKNIKCTFEDCKGRFSSDMAFRNHLRRNHNIRKRYNQPR